MLIPIARLLRRSLGTLLCESARLPFFIVVANYMSVVLLNYYLPSLRLVV